MLNKEAKIEEKKIESLIVCCAIFFDEINNKEVSNRLLFLSLSKYKTPVPMLKILNFETKGIK